MRRPALYRPNRPAGQSAWAHPYPTGLFNPVFYNAGPAVEPPVIPAVPSPADLAARTGQQPAQQPAPVVPAGQRVSDDPREVLIDKDTGQPMTQGRFSTIMTKTRDRGFSAAVHQIIEAAGLTADQADPVKIAELLKEGKQARQAQLSDEQRRAEELAERERAFEARELAAQQKEAEAARRDRESQVRAALVSLGATGDDLDDATELLRNRIADDATDAQITEAAGALKARRAELFGGTNAQILPPAPGGAPAGGPPPRTPAGGKDAVREAARARAISMGLRTDDAA